MYIVSNFSILVIDVARVPDTVTNIVIAHFVEYSITTKNDKVMILSNFEYFYFWKASNNIRVATLEFYFGFRISECSRYRKSTR